MMDYKALNGRIIVREEKAENICEIIRQIVQDKLDAIGCSEIIATVFMEFENCNETHIWHELNIEMLLGGGKTSYIIFATNDSEPNLTYENGDFAFFYVFDFAMQSCTSRKRLENTGFCDFNAETDYLIEEVIHKDLLEKLIKGGVL